MGSSATPSNLLGENKRGAIAVVFVHGYKVSCNNAIMGGNRLWKNLRAASKEKLPKTGPVSFLLQEAFFFTFCWRGDFGPIPFWQSEKAAKISAPSLATFLRELHTQLFARSHTFKLVLITHSLGAKVALEAFNQLRRSENSGWVTGTLLIQPAVDVESVTTHEFTEQYLRIPRCPGEPISDEFWPPTYVRLPSSRREGEYFKALSFSHRVVAAMSSADDALAFWFSLYAGKWWKIASHAFEDTIALGAMNFIEYKATGEVGRFGLWSPRLTYALNFTALDFPTKSGDVADLHNQIFRDPKLVQAIYEAILANWLMDQ